MRIAFCVLLVLALLAFAAPSHAMDFNEMASTVSHKIEEAIGSSSHHFDGFPEISPEKLEKGKKLLPPIYEGPTILPLPTFWEPLEVNHFEPTPQELAKLKNSKNWPESDQKAQESIEFDDKEPVSHWPLELKMSKNWPELDQNAQDALKSLFQWEVSVSKGESEMDVSHTSEWVTKAMERVKQAEEAGLGSLEFVRTPPLTRAIDWLSVGIRRLNLFRKGPIENKLFDVEDELSFCSSVADFHIKKVEERVEGIELAAKRLKQVRIKMEMSEKLIDGTEEKENLMAEIELHTENIVAFEKVTEWHKEDLEAVKAAFHIYVKAFTKTFPFELIYERQRTRTRNASKLASDGRSSFV